MLLSSLAWFFAVFEDKHIPEPESSRSVLGTCIRQPKHDEQPSLAFNQFSEGATM